jgi:hypothetical protein
MIDPTSGEIRFDATNVLTPWMPLATFQTLPMGIRAKPFGYAGRGYESYAADVDVEGAPWVVGVTFDQGRLHIVSMAPHSGRTWDDFSATEEAKTAAHIQSLLQKWLGVPAVKTISGGDQYAFPWGGVSAGVVPQNATASIAVGYKKG